MASVQIDTKITIPEGVQLAPETQSALAPAQTHSEIPVPKLTLDAIAQAIDQARDQVNAYTTPWKDALGATEVQVAAQRQAAARAAKGKKVRGQQLEEEDDEDQDEDEDEEEN